MEAAMRLTPGIPQDPLLLRGLTAIDMSPKSIFATSYTNKHTGLIYVFAFSLVQLSMMVYIRRAFVHFYILSKRPKNLKSS